MMLQLKNITYQIAGIPLLRDIDWTINPKKRVALIGPNGAGKTTLLRLICRELPLQEGQIIKPKSYQIGYLPQESISFGLGSVLSETLAARKELMDIETEIKTLQKKIADRELSDNVQHNLAGRLTSLQERFGILGGYTIEVEAKKILAGLGFAESEFNDPLSVKSGGWQMRVYLARLLLMNPNLLLLDEPTNHLDIESLEWLESYLSDFQGSMIIVSHDRYFVDRLADEIAELENKNLRHYPGKYTFYMETKALYLEQLQQKAEEIRAEKERLSVFINRFRYKNTKASQVQDRIKKLEKLQTVELQKPPPALSFRIISPQKSYKDVCELTDVSFKYDKEWVFEAINMQLYRGEKAALVGANGQGKTTLTRLISRELVPQRGNVRLGERVKIGYYAQHQIDNLNLNASIIQEVDSVAAEIYRTKIRDVLGIFKFSGDDVDKKIGVLSGGEKARVSLAKILLSPANFLLMDEPTNHLDLYSKEALEKALSGYDGTLLLISHDRYFLDKLVTIIFELKNGMLTRYEGNYSDYLARKKATVLSKPDFSAQSNQAGRKDKEKKRVEAEARQKISGHRKDLIVKINEIEMEIENLEKEKKQLESEMANPEYYKDPEKSAAGVKRYQTIQEQIPERISRWEKYQAEIESLLSGLKA
jgi:ATP-binding cassette subfamily F protein 3